jgi:hypothetical protein
MCWGVVRWLGWTLICGGVAGCGGESSRVFPRERIVPEAGSGGSNPGAPQPTPSMCSKTGEITTREGPCADSAAECGNVGGVQCGECAPGATCFQHRCYFQQGPGARGRPPLMRALRGAEEGQQFSLRKSGVLEVIEASLWTTERDLEARVYLWCDDQRVLVREYPLSAETIPRYAGISSDMTPVVIAIDPPLLLDEGQTIDVVFRTPVGPLEGFSEFTGTSGIHMMDRDSDSWFISENYAGVTSDVVWDYSIAAYIH